MAGKNKIVAGSALSIFAALFIQYQEGLKNYVYLDPVGIPTWCVGETQITLGKKIEVGKTFFSDSECMLILEKNLQKYNKPMETLNYDLPRGAHLAFLDFTLNAGETTMNRSGMMRNLKVGDVHSACDYLLKYKYAQGIDCSKSKQCSGVWRRRFDEWSVCTGKITPEDFLIKVAKYKKEQLEVTDNAD